MNRVRRKVRCEGCGREPALSSEGRWTCQCPSFQWHPQKGYEGEAKDRELLERYNWRMVNDSGFVYWMAPGNTGVVNLYKDGTWSGGSALFSKLEDYLDSHASRHRRSPSCRRRF